MTRPINYIDPTGHNWVHNSNIRMTDGDWDPKPWHKELEDDNIFSTID